MKNLRRNFERFCYRHRDKGIPNLMLYIAIGTAIMYIFGIIDKTNLLETIFYFDRTKILQGQVWRLITYVIIPADNNILFLAISLYFYYYIGKVIEGHWGTLRFNLFYFSGVLLTDAAALLFNVSAYILPLDLSLILAFATIFPENRVLLMYIIPIKMKYLAWVHFAWTLFVLIVNPLPYKLFYVFSLLNYFLFFGADVLQVMPVFVQNWFRQKPRTNTQKPNPNWAKDYRSKSGEQPYRHKCSVCGRTDTTHPDLEFRYCSRCSGYHCYCIDHINDHAHIQ